MGMYDDRGTYNDMYRFYHNVWDYTRFYGTMLVLDPGFPVGCANLSSLFGEM